MSLRRFFAPKSGAQDDNQEDRLVDSTEASEGPQITKLQFTNYELLWTVRHYARIYLPNHVRASAAIRERPSPARVTFAFALVYVFWGSTYLGINVAIRSIPPALMCATRFLISGPLMLAWCAISGHPIRITMGQAWRLAIIGILLLSGGNAMVAWSEQFTPTGVSALIVASVPLWVMVLERLLHHSEQLSKRGIAGLVIGIGGIVLLLWPKLTRANGMGHDEILGAAGLLFASLNWAMGSICSHRWCKPGAGGTVTSDVLSASAWQMIFAALANLLIALAFRQPERAHWTAQGLGAILYLVVFGSWVGYTAYIWLLKHVPTSKVSTYAYVNPIVAVLLGWAILGERVDGYVLAGSAVIVAAVALVTTANVKREGEAHGAVGALDNPECLEVASVKDAMSD